MFDVREKVASFWMENRTRVVQASFFALTLYWIYSAIIQNVLPVEGTILFLLLFASFSIDMIANRMDQIETLLPRSNRLFRNVNEANRIIEEFISNEKPSDVFLLEYNSISGKGIIDRARGNNCHVYILQRNPVGAVNEEHENLIIRRLMDMYEEGFDATNFTVRMYNRSASLKARKLGDDFVCVGWYTFDPRSPRSRQIWGQENPMQCFFRDREPGEFGIINDWIEGVYQRLWGDGTTPQELYVSEECPESLQDWVREAGELERKEREQWLEEISEGKSQREPLFSR